MASIAPIAIFTYNRPEHLQQTLDSLRSNSLFGQSTLYIFSDGPKAGADEIELERIKKVRKLIHQNQWCRRVEIEEAKSNRGLAESLVTGISSVLQVHDRVIILEDDLETSSGFLRYMNDALDVYKDEEQVFQVSGFMVKNRPWVSQTGFLRVSTSWGWATWRRAWRYYRPDAQTLLEEVEAKGRSAFDLGGYSFHFDELERNVKGDLNTWAVKWYASIFMNDGLCLYPRKSLVRNLGFDGTGTHCNDSKSGFYKKTRLAKMQSVKPVPIEEDPQYLKVMQRHYRDLLREWTGTRLRDRFGRKLKKVAGLNR